MWQMSPANEPFSSGFGVRPARTFGCVTTTPTSPQTSVSEDSTGKFGTKTILGFVIVLAAVIAGVVSYSAQAIVPTDVRTDTPIVLDGRVYAVTQIGSRVIVGGDFQQVRTGTGGQIIDQAYIYAYDIDSGEFDVDFRPTLDGEVRDLENDPEGNHVYIAGKFKNIAGEARGRIARFDLRDMTVDRRFRASANSKVESVAVVGDELVMGGNFTKVKGQAREYLAKVDRKTGKLAVGFNVNFGEAIGRSYRDVNGIIVRTGGVHRVALQPGGTQILVAHRHDTIDGIAKPGIAMFAADGTLQPWYTDVYSSTNCQSRGVAITDVSWSPDGQFFAVGHTGHDTGIVCDALVKFSVAKTDATEMRTPLWSSRVFDSIFAVEYGPDAIYLGGHFRYLVSPTSPLPYPGKTTGPYTADPTRDGTFKADLVDTGYVYRAVQIGAISPSSGRGIPTWAPTSNAAKGILTMTLVDRGLLIGQDNGKINNQVVGRSALFDITPDAGVLDCRVSLDGSGHPVVTWRGIADAGETYTVKRNGKFLQNVNGTSVVDTSAMGGQTTAFSLTFRRYETSRTEYCGSVVATANGTTNIAGTAAVKQSSVAYSGFAARAIDGNTNGDYTRNSVTHTATEVEPWLELNFGNSAEIDGLAIWNRTDCCAERLDNVSIFISNNPFTSTDMATTRAQAGVVELTAATVGESVTFNQNVSGQYIRVQVPGTVLSIAELEVFGTVRADLVCTATATGTDINVTWNDINAGNHVVVSDGNRFSTVGTNTAFTDTNLAPGDHTYEVRAISNGQRIDTATCGANIAVPTVSCSVAVVGGQPVVSWDDNGWTSINIARNGKYLSSATGVSFTDTTANLTGDQSYEVRARINGFKVVGDCGVVTLP